MAIRAGCWLSAENCFFYELLLNMQLNFALLRRQTGKKLSWTVCKGGPCQCITSWFGMCSIKPDQTPRRIKMSCLLPNNQPLKIPETANLQHIASNLDIYSTVWTLFHWLQLAPLFSRHQLHSGGSNFYLPRVVHVIFQHSANDEVKSCCIDINISKIQDPSHEPWPLPQAAKTPNNCNHTLSGLMPE